MKIRNIIYALLCGVLLISCENGENNELPPKPIEKQCYKGTMTVDQNDGSFYTREDVEVDYEIKDGVLNFVMYKVKFAQGMPLTLDMVVEGVTYSESPEGYILTGDGIVPYAMGGPFEKYTITSLQGNITESCFSLSFNCGEYPVTYEGSR